MPTERAGLNAELRAPLLVLLVVLPVLAGAGWWTHATLAAASSLQNRVRTAQIARERVLRLQLNEETGLRGYLATGDLLYLEPYKKAEASTSASFDALSASLVPLQLPSAEESARAEREINARWLVSFAQPLIASPGRSATSLELQRRGKQSVDDLRNRDQELQERLDSLAAESDERTQSALFAMLLFVVGGVLVVAASAAFFGYRQARAAREAFEARVLYENQKRIADALQTAFLNEALPVSPSVSLHATYLPATAETKVGGDWYDAFELPDKRILFSIGDVAGHGLEAAVAMSRARQTILAAALHESDPAKVLERANETLLLNVSRMVTAICGYISPDTLEIVYATAGHPPPILAFRNRPATFLPHSGLPLGMIPRAVYRTYAAHAHNEGMLVLYTDGVIEHKRNIIEGEARLLEAAALALADENPALAIRRHVFAESSPTDDVAILTIKFVKQGDVARPPSLEAWQAGRVSPALEHAWEEASPGALGIASRPESEDMDRALRVIVRPVARREADPASSLVHRKKGS